MTIILQREPIISWAPVYNNYDNKGLKFYGWMDELGFYVPSTVFQSFRDRVNMKGSVQ